jgi:hypothetical protein
MRTALFWVVTQRVVAISYRPFGTTYRSPLKMGPICCSQRSIINCHYSLRNNPEERSSHLLRGGSLKSEEKLLSASCRSAGVHLIMIVTPGPMVVPLSNCLLNRILCDYKRIVPILSQFTLPPPPQDCKIICITETRLEFSLYSDCLFPYRYSVRHVVSHLSEFSVAQFTTAQLLS